MFHFRYLYRVLHPIGHAVKTMKMLRVLNLKFFSFNMLIPSLKHLTTLRLNGSPTGGAMDKGIFVKFKEKLRYAFFFNSDEYPSSQYILPYIDHLLP